MRKMAIRMTIGMGVMALGAHQVPAQQTGANCAPRPVVLERLSEKFGESRQSIGLGSNNRVVELFASDNTGSWTITVTMPDGTTCLVAAGDAFERVSEVRPTGDPA
ncbi:MAG: hypothetical protein CML66_01605 [Rhodobacteraceae bacterium]|nr:hypothetical protein [Paracoccaceae bacterium]MAY45929.1 hypothetical protein [Paracoccaceae bacterium]QEW18812.1 hypothetical protein LA6_000987 [Marinibacterium anthonyi]